MSTRARDLGEDRREGTCLRGNDVSLGLKRARQIGAIQKLIEPGLSEGESRVRLVAAGG